MDNSKYSTDSEREIKPHLVENIQEELREIYSEVIGIDNPDLVEDKVADTINFERFDNSTINNFQCFGVQHRPDIELNIQRADFNIALEIKKGQSGHDIRTGIGQAMVYVKKYDFIIYLFIDTSKDGKIHNSLSEEFEEFMLEELWSYNIRLATVQE